MAQTSSMPETVAALSNLSLRVEPGKLAGMFQRQMPVRFYSKIGFFCSFNCSAEEEEAVDRQELLQENEEGHELQEVQERV